MSQSPEEPEIVTHRIPRIEVYQVTDDELTRIEDGYGQVSQDLTFAVTSLSFCIAFAIALMTGSFSAGISVTLLLFAVVFAFVPGRRAPIQGRRSGARQYLQASLPETENGFQKTPVPHRHG